MPKTTLKFALVNLVNSVEPDVTSHLDILDVNLFYLASLLNEILTKIV